MRRSNPIQTQPLLSWGVGILCSAPSWLWAAPLVESAENTAPPAAASPAAANAQVAASPVPKRAALRQLIRAEGALTNAIIFCNRKRDVATLARSLERHGFSAGALHGDMDQKSRMETLDAFKTNKLTLLVASDVAARGLEGNLLRVTQGGRGCGRALCRSAGRRGFDRTRCPTTRSCLRAARGASGR